MQYLLEHLAIYVSAMSGVLAARGKRIDLFGVVVLGVVTSKTPALENKDAIKRRIDEATKYVPLERLALSPQCGFASTIEGNALSEEQQFAKLRHV